MCSHLDVPRHVSDPHPVAVVVGDDDDAVAALGETLRQLEEVRLHAARVRVEKVGHQGHVEPGARRGSCCARHYF